MTQRLAGKAPLHDREKVREPLVRQPEVYAVSCAIMLASMPV